MSAPAPRSKGMEMAAAARHERAGAALAQVLEQHVGAQREAHGAQRHARPARRQQLQHEPEVARIARVVEARQAVGPAAARAEVQRHRADAAVPQRATALLHVGRVGAPLQAVDDHDVRRALARGARTAGDARPVEVQEIAVGRVDALAAVAHAGARPQVPARHRLRVRPAQPPRGLERPGDEAAHAIAGIHGRDGFAHACVRVRGDADRPSELSGNRGRCSTGPTIRASRGSRRGVGLRPRVDVPASCRGGGG